MLKFKILQGISEQMNFILIAMFFLSFLIYYFLIQSLNFFVLRECFPLEGCGNWSYNPWGTWVNWLAFPSPSSWLKMLFLMWTSDLWNLYNIKSLLRNLYTYLNKMVRKVIFLVYTNVLSFLDWHSVSLATGTVWNRPEAQWVLWCRTSLHCFYGHWILFICNGWDFE